jgi:hypothetical protein
MALHDKLVTNTRPDLATIFSLLSSYMHHPSPGHLEAVKHVGKYILSTMDLGLHFMSKPNSSLESYVHFPLSDDDPLSPSVSPNFNSFCDANWGPQDASKPSATDIHEVSIKESRSICGHICLWGLSNIMENAQGSSYQPKLLGSRS